MMNSVFLPTSLKEINALGWESADIILFTGDAYVDHPAFGAAVIWAGAGERGIQGGHCATAKLERRFKGFPQAWQAKTFFCRYLRQYGFDG